MNARCWSPIVGLSLGLVAGLACTKAERHSQTPTHETPKSPSSDEIQRTSELGQLTFTLPKTWQVERPAGSEIYSDARGGPGYVTPLVIQVRADQSLDEALEALLRSFHAAKAFTRHRIEPVIVDGEQALSYLVSFDYMEHVHWQVGTLIADRGHIVALFLSAPDAELINGMKVFDRALQTLHFAESWHQILEQGQRGAPGAA